jgi:hypothetical protein
MNLNTMLSFSGIFMTLHHYSTVAASVISNEFARGVSGQIVGTFAAFEKHGCVFQN